MSSCNPATTVVSSQNQATRSYDLSPVWNDLTADEQDLLELGTEDNFWPVEVRGRFVNLALAQEALARLLQLRQITLEHVGKIVSTDTATAFIADPSIWGDSEFGFEATVPAGQSTSIRDRGTSLMPPKTRSRRFRFRTWLRRVTPHFIADRIGKGSSDCGSHEWYNQDGVTDHCYHCTVGRRSHMDAARPD